jgi:hypothetical protein
VHIGSDGRRVHARQDGDTAVITMTGAGRGDLVHEVVGVDLSTVTWLLIRCLCQSAPLPVAIERRITSSHSPEGSGRTAIIADLQAARGRDVVLHAQPGDDVMVNGLCVSAATVIASPRTSGSPPARRCGSRTPPGRAPSATSPTARPPSRS